MKKALFLATCLGLGGRLLAQVRHALRVFRVLGVHHRESSTCRGEACHAGGGPRCPSRAARNASTPDTGSRRPHSQEILGKWKGTDWDARRAGATKNPAAHLEGSRGGAASEARRPAASSASFAKTDVWPAAGLTPSSQVAGPGQGKTGWQKEQARGAVSRGLGSGGGRRPGARRLARRQGHLDPSPRCAQVLPRPPGAVNERAAARGRRLCLPKVRWRKGRPLTPPAAGPRSSAA